MKKIKVCIPTAGIGKRLSNFTKVLNKSLVDIDLKPAISHIIDNFPKNTEFVIPLGYKGTLVKNFLHLTYPERKFHFVYVRKFKGNGSGLGLTLLKAKKYLQSPFIFISCDTIFKGKIPSLKNNWIGFSEKRNHNNYRGIRIDKKKYVTHFLNKKFKSDKLNKTYIGMAGIKNYKDFWKNMESDKIKSIKLGEVFGLMKLNDKILAKSFEWNDIGNLKALNYAKDKINKKSLKHNILEKSDEKIWFVNNKVIKFFKNGKIAKNRVKRSLSLKNYIPKILAKKNNLYSYQYCNGEIFSNIDNINIFKNLLDYIWKFHNSKKKNLSKKFQLKCLKFYKHKTEERLKLFYRRFNVIDEESKINNVKIPKLKLILDMIDWKHISKGIICNFHGDLHFENILYSRKSKSFKFLDWRQDFQGEIFYGDAYYDYAKLMHGLLVSHEMVRKNKYKIKWNKYNIFFSIKSKNIYKQYLNYFILWLEQKKIDVRKVNIITGLIYLNIAPLHHYPYSLFLYAIGKKMVFENINYESKKIYN